MSTLELMERELHLKQLQINRLLTITQAINDNVSAAGLYDMYKSFLSWEMGVKKMALYVRQDDQWVCPSSIGLSEANIKTDISEELPKFQRLQNLDGFEDHPLISHFDIVIPVLHKRLPIAFTFIGGFDENEDMYSKVQFITTITNVIAVAIENKRLFKRQLEQTLYKKEMELASDMQRMLIPMELPVSDHYELASIYKPHLGVGGDYFDFLELDDGNLAFCIADISGKGMAAALLMANFQANFHSLIRKRDELGVFVRELNESLFRITKGEKFLTFFIAIFDRESSQLQYVNAGHNPPLLVRENEVTQLTKGSTILGSFSELPQVEVGQERIASETFLLMYTDGLTDIKNEQGEYFEEQLLQEFAQSNHQQTATAFNKTLIEQIDRFKGDQSYPDDFTVLTCKLLQD